MQATQVQAIITLGSGVTPTGEPSPGTALRTAKAIELADLFPRAVLIMSGAMPLHPDAGIPGGTEADVMKKYALARHIAPARVLLENKSHTTLDNALFTKKHCLEPRQLRTLVVVTSGYHIPRAEYLFRKILGPDYRITCISAGGETKSNRLLKEERSLAFFRALLDTVTDGDDAEARRRLSDWLEPYATHPPFTLEQWHAYKDHGKPLPAFPDYQ